MEYMDYGVYMECNLSEFLIFMESLNFFIKVSNLKAEVKR